MEFSGPNDALQAFGVTFIGMTPDNGRKLLLTISFVIAAILIGRVLNALAGRATRGDHWPKARFWVRQIVKIVTALFVVIGVISIWFDDPTRLATGLGLVTAGVAFALQRVITAVAG